MNDTMKQTLEQEDKIIADIVDALTSLEKDTGAMETTESRLEAYTSQKKAIADIRNFLRQAERLEMVAGGEPNDYASGRGEDEEQMGKALIQIDYTLKKLDGTLEALSDDNDSKLKAWYEQRKALHEIKRILHLIDRYMRYDADELPIYPPMSGQ